MALQGVAGYQYAERIKTLLDSFRITGRKGFGFVIRALLSRVLQRRDYPKAAPIPKSILEKAQDVKDLLDQVSMWIPMDPKKKKDPAYRLEVLDNRTRFKKTIRNMTQEKVKELRLMPDTERKALVAKHQQMVDQQKKQVLLFAQAKQKVKKRITVTNNQYVEERNQIFTNLGAPLTGQGLSPEQLANMSILVDRELFPYDYLPVLTADMTLAHWLSSTPIFRLIDEGFLKQGSRADLILMTEPDPAQMKRLSAFSAAIVAGYVSLDQVVNLKITDDVLIPLLDSSLQQRLEDKAATTDDLSIFTKMGLDVRQRNNQPKLK